MTSNADFQNGLINRYVNRPDYLAQAFKIGAEARQKETKLMVRAAAIGTGLLAATTIGAAVAVAVHENHESAVPSTSEIRNNGSAELGSIPKGPDDQILGSSGFAANPVNRGTPHIPVLPHIPFPTGPQMVQAFNAAVALSTAQNCVIVPPGNFTIENANISSVTFLDRAQNGYSYSITVQDGYPTFRVSARLLGPTSAVG